MDSTAPDVLDDMTSNVPIDMEVAFTTPFYSQSNITIDDVELGVSQQDYVTATQQVVFANVQELGRKSKLKYNLLSSSVSFRNLRPIETRE